MSDNSVDPSGNTEAFRAFQTAPAEKAAPTSSKTPMIAVGVVVAVVLIALIVWLAS